MQNVSLSAAAADEFVLFEHPVLPRQIVNVSGFSWVAFFVGPLWLFWKRLWPWAIGVVFAAGALYFLLGAAGVTQREVNCVNYFGTKSCEHEDNPWVLLTVQVLINFVCGSYGHQLWGEDLLRRGYVVANVLKAKSVDHARALLARTPAWRDTQRDDG